MRLSAVVTVVVVVLGWSAMGFAQDDRAKREAELEHMVRILPESKPFSDWLKRTGALPPDFDKLPLVPFIQDPLVMVKDGQSVKVTPANWAERREQIAAGVEDWLLGHAPPAPGNVIAEKVEKTTEDDREVWKVRLAFGPDHKAKLDCTLYLPTGQRPAPVFMGDSIRYRSWAATAMKQGYAYCRFNAADRGDQSKAWKDLFGDYDWSDFRRRGWAASRCIDWLITLDFIDPNRVYIGGHSRAAKSIMSAAAFDERIAGVIASSPGSGGSMPYRYSDQTFYGESAEILTRVFPGWVLPNVRLFAGRENRLPTDSHMIYALLAPRPVLMSSAWNDWVEGTWSIEQVFKTIQPVYAMLGKPENIGLRYRPGQHRADAATIRDFNSFLVASAGLGEKKQTVAEMFPFKPFHVWDYAEWEKAHGFEIKLDRFPVNGYMLDPTIGADDRKLSAEQWQAKRKEILAKLAWLLGDGPAYKPMPVTIGEGETDEVAKMLARDWPAAPEKTKCRFGDGINGNIYYPDAQTPGSGEKLPGIVWLGPLHCSSGYTGSYRAGDIAHIRLARGGAVVLAYDAIGTGSRQEERRGFYAANPDWSLMGKMVLDARHAIDALAKVPEVDGQRIYLVGYAMGGMVATLTAATDDRVAGVVSVAGLTPFRMDTDKSGTGGVRRYSHLFGWIPRLGPFVGKEPCIPVDFNEILACVAPRRALIIAPLMDWHATHSEVLAAAKAAGGAYALLGAPDGLTVDSPDDWNRLTNAMMDRIVDWVAPAGEPGK